MKNDVKVVLFDLGNTLIHDEPASWADVYLRADRSLWSFLRKFGVNTSTQELLGDHKTLLDYYYQLREGDLEEPGIGTVLRDLLNAHKIPSRRRNYNRRCVRCMRLPRRIGL